MAAQPQDQDIDISQAFGGAGHGVSISEHDRLIFAKQVLGVIALVCMAVFVAYAMYPDNKALSSIFELVKIGALPLITLVISFYFPNSAK